MGGFGYNLLSKIIRNDAFRQDPAEVYNWRVFALASAVSAHAPSNGQFHSSRKSIANKNQQR